MGYYINPPKRTKEEFLHQYGIKISTRAAERQDIGKLNAEKRTIVCLVDNGPFKALGIAFSKLELMVFTDLRDSRSKNFYVINHEHITTAIAGIEASSIPWE